MSSTELAGGTTVVGSLSNIVRVEGGRLQSGDIPVAGFKHAAVQVIAAAVALNRRTTIHNIPQIKDSLMLTEIIRACGGRAELDGTTLSIDAASLRMTEIPGALSRQIHGSLYLLPAFLARLGEVQFGKSGGCQIGSVEDEGERPLDHMLSVMQRFGARFERRGQAIFGRCSGFRHAVVDILDYSDNSTAPNGPLVSGATKTAVLCALSCDQGASEILNPYTKPDVLELLRFARQCGFGVEYDQRRIRIRPNGGGSAVSHDLVSDVSEILTYIALSQHTGVPLRLTEVTTDRAMEGLRAELELLDSMGVGLVWGPGEVAVRPAERVRAQHIRVTSTSIYSDHQPFFALMLTRGEGPSLIEERVWKDRFQYVEGLNRLGARIAREGAAVRIEPSALNVAGQTVTASDLRGAAVLLVGALAISGETTVENVDHLERGYDRLYAKLARLGASIQPVGDQQAAGGEG